MALRALTMVSNAAAMLEVKRRGSLSMFQPVCLSRFEC